MKECAYEACFNTFEPKKTFQIYCCKQCSVKAKIERAKVYKIKKCIICNEEFRTSHKGTVTCGSEACKKEKTRRESAKWNKIRQAKKPKGNCPVCDEKIAKGRSKYCGSKECEATRQRAANEKWKENNPDRVKAIHKKWKDKNPNRDRGNRTIESAKRSAYISAKKEAYKAKAKEMEIVVKKNEEKELIKRDLNSIEQDMIAKFLQEKANAN